MALEETFGRLLRFLRLLGLLCLGMGVALVTPVYDRILIFEYATPLHYAKCNTICIVHRVMLINAVLTLDPKLFDTSTNTVAWTPVQTPEFIPSSIRNKI